MKRPQLKLILLLLLAAVQPAHGQFFGWFAEFFTWLFCDILNLGCSSLPDKNDDSCSQLDDPPCLNGGVCRAESETGYACTCPTGYDGTDCETTVTTTAPGGGDDVACTGVFPADNIWNVRIDDLPVHPLSDDYVASIGYGNLHPDFGSFAGYGIPYSEVGVGADRSSSLVDIVYTGCGDESDPGPFPIPADAPIEGGAQADGDRHVIVLDRDSCMLYELYHAFPQPDGSWEANSGAKYDLTSHDLRPDGWTSADAAGLPIFPGLIRYNEGAQGSIHHALRFTASRTQRAYVWPARHYASAITDTSVPPMGQRFRLKANFDISGFSPQIQVILRAFQRYGIILADNGSNWFISGTSNDLWDDDILGEIKTIPGSSFEAVDVSSLLIDPDSGRANV